MIQAVIFDLDGTLIDTEPAAARAIVDYFQSWNIQVDSSDAAFITGRTWETAFQFLFKKYEMPVCSCRPNVFRSREVPKP
jgi:beta-phosphoglucomutase-like phosphatase (HAD superfamily)